MWTAPLSPQNLRAFADGLRLPGGQSLTVRFVEAGDIAPLLAYLRSLSRRSRYNRFFGARFDLADSEVTRILHTGEANQFAVIGELNVDGMNRIACEARYAFDPDFESCEFGLSVGDDWQGIGIGVSLLGNLECRAAALGARRLLGDTLRGNEEMLGLARKRGFALMHSPDDWKLVRIEKPVTMATNEIPCAKWRRIASDAVMPAH